MSKNHKTTLVEYNDRSAEIDEEISDLVLELWRSGIIPHSSCQGSPDEDTVLIQFDTAEDALHFLHIVASHGDDLDLKILQHSGAADWDYCVHPHVEVDNRQGTIEFLTCVHFPKDDLPAVEKCMKEHNEEPE